MLKSSQSTPSVQGTIDASSVAPFVRKTYELVSDASTDNVVCWNPEGTSFLILNPHSLQSKVLPKYFKHSNLCSFIRQLNTYGFRKILPSTSNKEDEDSRETMEFKHPLFTRENTSTLVSISRNRSQRKKSQSQTVGDLPKMESSPSLLPSAGRLTRAFFSTPLPGGCSPVQSSVSAFSEFDSPSITRLENPFDHRDSSSPSSASSCGQGGADAHILHLKNEVGMLSKALVLLSRQCQRSSHIIQRLIEEVEELKQKNANSESSSQQQHDEEELSGFGFHQTPASKRRRLGFDVKQEVDELSMLENNFFAMSENNSNLCDLDDNAELCDSSDWYDPPNEGYPF